MKAKITEIFKSIQGEGKYLGSEQVFVRFANCNLNCIWCDTKETIDDSYGVSKEYSVGELIVEINNLYQGCHSLSLTGGEPLLQKDFLKELLVKLKFLGITTYLETNGILFGALKEVIERIDIIAMDIKLPSSTKCKPFWQEHRKFLKIAKDKDVFIKTVISADTAKDDIMKAVDLVAEIDPNLVFVLQPNYFEMDKGAWDECKRFNNFCKTRLKNVKIIPQIHKFIGIK